MASKRRSFISLIFIINNNNNNNNNNNSNNNFIQVSGKNSSGNH